MKGEFEVTSPVLIHPNSLGLTFLFCSLQNHLRMKRVFDRIGFPVNQAWVSEKTNQRGRELLREVPSWSPSKFQAQQSRKHNRDKSIRNTTCFGYLNSDSYKFGQGFTPLGALPILSSQIPERKLFILDHKSPCLCFWSCQAGFVQSTQSSSLELQEYVSILRQEQC